MTVRGAWTEAALDGLPGASAWTPRSSGATRRRRSSGRRARSRDALRGLLKNALQASPPDAPRALRVDAERGDGSRVAVADRGRGHGRRTMLARVGEPFFTTKGPGEGMGLGLFLTRALAEQLGGEFHIALAAGRRDRGLLELRRRRRREEPP